MAVLNNHGTINNYGTIYGTAGILNNYDDGTINNSGTIQTQDLFFNNYGTVNNFTLGLYEGTSPSDLVVNLGQAVRAVVDSKDSTFTQVTFKWINPIGETVRTDVVRIVSGQAEDDFTPDEYGQWIVAADFGDGTVLYQTLFVSFNVVPESPIGIIALTLFNLRDISIAC